MREKESKRGAIPSYSTKKKGGGASAPITCVRPCSCPSAPFIFLAVINFVLVHASSLSASIILQTFFFLARGTNDNLELF